MENTRIRVGEAPFSIGDEYLWLAQRDDDGAVVTFIGKVRNHNLGADVSALTLEHYPSAHRNMAFAANAFIMDDLKTRAPFWKCETTSQGDRWVDARASDHRAAGSWRRG
ncbi:molybdopterin synthase, large subunit [Serratia symbiotica str. Tucson]|uniref:Molybdopterin synthase catalytic subunit n=2 Tax=Serratia symbiotica TaxID=138074 RepID=E9CKC6_9GAMM|nr:molybdenum cofactor biosynthesis protein MoaE [Serratia symbiotica]EFW13038.1 molybdopterin synthase, large subunit [Serratia symbiotica str. Tucson]BBI92936.1 molybdopterin synthase large subunit [Serratia symbiotica]